MSQTSLSSPAVILYPLHLTFQNFAEEQSRKLIEQDLTVFSHLLASFRKKLETCKSFRHQTEASQGLNKEHQMKAMRDCIETCFRPLAKSAMARLTCESSNKKTFKAHVLLASYVTDISESGDKLSIKYRSKVTFLFKQCSVEKP